MSRDDARTYVAEALSQLPDGVCFEAKQHLRAALGELDSDHPTPLEECPVCGVVGLAERIATHDCAAAEQRRRRR